MIKGDYEKFKTSVYRITMIDLSSYKEQQMRRRIDQLITRNSITNYDDYAVELKKKGALFDEFVNYITINVSEFYRNPDQWKLMDETFIPELRKKFGDTLKIWSAACSTGDEPYSLVMCFSKHLPLNRIKIDATDLDKTVIEKAKVGLYNAKSVNSVPKDLKEKYFTKIGPSYQIAQSIKSRVGFREHNLLKDPYPTNCDLIVCRNVLIYFTEDAKDEIFLKFYKSLKKGGILFIGNTEQIKGFKEMGYIRRNSFFYEKA